MTPGTYLTPHQALVTTLRNAGISCLNVPDPGQRDFNWYNPDGSPGSPYYKEAEEPQQGFPFVIYDVTAGEPDHTMGDSYPEKFEVRLDVVAGNPLIHHIGSPYGNPMVSPIAYLDMLSSQPFVLNGVRFICCKLIRKSWELMEDDTRAPQDDSPGGGVYNSVYIARAIYEMELGATYPTPTRG